MNRFLLYLFIFFIFTKSLFSSDYPQTFSQLGTPLYKSLDHISKYADIKLLEDKILTFEQQAGRVMAHGFSVDKTKEKSQIKEYLTELRKLQKSYDYLLHIIHQNINQAIDKKDYELFLKLTNYELDGLLKNSKIKNKSIVFYNKNKTKKRSKFLEQKIKRKKLIEESTQEFYNQVVASTYDPNSKIDSTKKVFIETKRSGDYIYVVFKNKNIYDVTVSVKSQYKNITEAQNTPKEIVVKANSTNSYTKLHLGKGEKSYSYSYSWIIGDKNAVHDDDYIYKLPFASGTSHRVSQGYDTIHTHKGSSKYAIDFAMKEGTQIFASRGGVVVKTKSDSNIGGYAEEFAKYGNYVTIAHSDGTFGTYYHLKQYGVLVKEGDIVEKGYALGYSGNTGYSSGPHLHFSVFSAISAKATHSIPIKFASSEGIISEPKKGILYQAQ